LLRATGRSTGRRRTRQQVLDHFQKVYESEIEAAGYTRQKVEAQPGGEGPRGTNTITSEWSAGAGAASSDHGKSRRESSEEIKRRHFKR
jgi:hypothetical protein